MTFFLSILEYLLQYEVELSFRLVHLVSLEQTKVSSTEKMVRVVHDDLVGSGVEKRSLDGIERERERDGRGGGREIMTHIMIQVMIQIHDTHDV